MPDPRALIEQLDASSFQLIERFFDSFNLEAYVKQTLAALGNPTSGFSVVAIGFQQFDIGRSNRVHGQPSGVLRQIFLVFELDRKSTRLNSSHLGISYAVFCLKKKKRLIDT